MNERVRLHVELFSGMLASLDTKERVEVLRLVSERHNIQVLKEAAEPVSYEFEIAAGSPLAEAAKVARVVKQHWEAEVDRSLDAQLALMSGRDPDPHGKFDICDLCGEYERSCDCIPWALAWALAWAEIAGAQARQTLRPYESGEGGHGFSGDRFELLAYLRHAERTAAAGVAAARTAIEKWRDAR